MENEIKDLLKKYSSESFKNEVQSLSPPTYESPLPDFKVNNIWKVGESPADKFDALLKFNKEISESLVKERSEVESLKAELKQIRESHKHDVLKQVLITIFGCALSFLLGHFLP